MAFLHSVLKDVCDKQPYKVGKEGLNEIVNTHLKDKLCSGHEGFKRVIDKVADGVGGYNRAVESSNEAVRNIVTGMQKNMKSLQTQVSGILKDNVGAGDLELKQPVTFTPEEVKEAMDKIDSHLNSCLDVTYNFNIDMHSAKTRINDVNHTLRVNVNNVRMFVQHENDRLKASTKTSRDDMYEMQQTVGYVLHELRMKVNGSIKFQVENLVSMLKNKVADIRAQLKDVNKLHRKYVDVLTQWIKDVDMFIEQQGEKNVQKILDEVKWSNDGNKPQNWNNVVCAADELKAKAQSLCTAGQAARVAAEQYVREAQDAVYHLDYGLKQDLKKMREDIKTKIWQEIKTLKVMDLGGDVNVDLRRLESGIKESVTTYIKGYVNAVKTNVDKIKGNGQDDGLAGVNKHIVEIYAKEFKNGTDAFDKIVKTWLEDIFKYNVSVKDSIKEALDKIIINLKHLTLSSTYVDKIKSKIEDGQIQHIAGAIKDRIKTEGSVTFETFEHRVYKCVNNFATTLGNKLGKDEHDSPTRKQFVKDIASEIGKKVVQDGSDDSGLINYLIDAATAILAALYSKASDIASELKSLAAINGSSKSQVGKKLDDAYNDANNLSTQLSAALRGSNRHAYVPDPGSLSKPDDSLDTKIGAAIDGQFTSGPTVIVDVAGSQAAYELSKVMKSFHTNYSEIRKSLRKNIEGKVDQEIGTEKEHGGTYDFRMKSLSLDKLESYIKCIGQDNIKNGSLPKAIENIENHVKSALSPIDGLNDEAKQQFQKVDQHLDVLCAVIRRDGEELKDQLKILKNNKIAKELKQIKDDLDNLRKTMFYNVLRETRHFIEEVAPRLEKETIQCLQDFLNNEVQKAKNLLTTRARRNYVTSVKALLTAFATKVTQELQPLPAAIDEDLRIGFKGFVKKIETHFIPNVKLIGSLSRSTTTYVEIVEKSPQRSAALSIRLGFEGFLYSLWRQEDVKCDDLKVESLYTPLKTLLDGLEKSQHFDHDFCKNRETFSAAVNLFSPETMEGAPQKLLMPVKYGLQKFLEELKKAYVNQYSGVKFERDLLDGKFLVDHKSQPTATYDLNEYGEKLSKVCLTFLRNLALGFEILRETLIDISNPKTLTSKIHIGNALGDFFAKRGFAVSTGDVKQDGELRNHENMKGEHVHEKLKSADFMERLHDLFNHLSTYNQVCHIRHIPDGKPPRDIRRMLTWMSGLGNNPVYGPLKEYLKTLFPKPNDPNSPPNPNPSLSAYPTDITYQNLTSTLDLIPAYSYKLLTRVLGFGHEGGRYACDIFTNEDDLLYPTSSGQCFDMFIDMLFRLRQQLCFLYTQCHNGPDSSGWSDCYYGRNVAGSAWNCNDLKCPNQQCPQKVDQKGGQIGNQTATQTCDQHPTCGLKSPLQSFLEDGLQGFLPHSITSPGCKLTCSLSNHRGIPCKTPMGFGDIATVASHTKTGIDLKRVLGQYCGQQDSPLTKLCSLLSCLVSRPPQNLGDMFAFYYGFLADWNGGFYKYEKTAYTQDAFNESVNDANFGTSYTALDPSPLFNRTDHAESHSKGDLLSISTCTSDSKETCGLYLRPLASNVYTIFSSKYKSNYLSWIVYITETFNDLLQKLYDDCNSKCGKMQNKCRGVICIRDCPTAIPSDKSRNHTSECGSIVKCPDTYPTLCKYGFTFGSAYDLSGRGRHPHQRRTCNNFCEALKKVLSNKESDGAPLAKLIFRTILPDIVSPLVAVAPVPAAHRRRPPRRPEDAPPEITRSYRSAAQSFRCRIALAALKQRSSFSL
ncbi:hypothetical protein, conserved [Babesia ovata]|uniref:C3H1-type domain-containing protein n=1 Tax=Babesia ovata TaxID=189622 RepID=A0A2H6KJ63_9APIC|nr:uncharacterized protein BOVATA_045280 [Babesia ovata]GBE63035.1 hypothetical protein, conserved [Babesia ovata]